MKRTLRIVLPLYALLLTVGIPWYWPADDRTLLAGVPAWVLVAAAASVAASLLTIMVLVATWPRDE